MEKKQDKYDLAVEYLTANSSEIYKAWVNPSRHPYGHLFKYVRKYSSHGSAFECGCPTMIRQGRVAYNAVGTPDVLLTEAIKKDARLPLKGSAVTIVHLPVFAEWQRRIDKYYETGILESTPSEPKEEPAYRFVEKHPSVEPLLDNVMYYS